MNRAIASWPRRYAAAGALPSAGGRFLLVPEDDLRRLAVIRGEEPPAFRCGLGGLRAPLPRTGALGVVVIAHLG